MPRYQPPIITGGNRNNPTWSELMQYYLPQQQGMSSPQLPMLSDPMALAQQYQQPFQPAMDRGTTPSPWTAGGSSYEEIMRRLNEGGRAVPTRPYPTEGGEMPAAPTAAPMSAAQPSIPTEDGYGGGAFVGRPLANGQVGGGLRGDGGSTGGGYVGPGAWGGAGQGSPYSGMPGFLQGAGTGYQQASPFNPSASIPGVGSGFGGQSALGWNAVSAGNNPQSQSGIAAALQALGINPANAATLAASLVAGPAGGLIMRQIMNRGKESDDASVSGTKGGGVFSRLGSALNMFRSGRG